MSLKYLLKMVKPLKILFLKKALRKLINLLSLKERKKISTLHQSIFPSLTLSLI